MNERNDLAPGFGKRIKDRRKELKMTQRELAKKSGVAFRSIQDYEGEKRTPKVEVRIKLSNALNASYTDLFMDMTPESFDGPEDFWKWANEVSKPHEGISHNIEVIHGDHITNKTDFDFYRKGLTENEASELDNYYSYLMYKRNNPPKPDSEE